MPVFDVGNTEAIPCFIISKYIEGCTLAEKIKEKRISLRTSIKFYQVRVRISGGVVQSGRIETVHINYMSVVRVVLVIDRDRSVTDAT